MMVYRAYMGILISDYWPTRIHPQNGDDIPLSGCASLNCALQIYAQKPDLGIQNKRSKNVINVIN